jgi:glucose/mannose-6-phosphate isomerase
MPDGPVSEIPGTDGREPGNPLDDAATRARLDRENMLGAVARTPELLRDAWARSRELTLGSAYRDATSVAVVGMGGSAIGGDLVSATFAERLRTPLAVVRDYELPAWVGPETLVVASSFSGATEETIAALQSALERRCPVVILATGGPLLEVARRAELPHVAFPGSGQPRAAIGYSLGLLCGVLERAGVLGLEDEEVDGAAEVGAWVTGACGPDRRAEDNVAKRVAWSLVDRLPIVVGSGHLAAVARRWKTQFNENGKSAAMAEALPEAAHNTVVGFGHPEWQREQAYVVFLRGSAEHARNRLRADLLGVLLDDEHVSHETVELAGADRLGQAVAGIVTGDYVSVYLGLLYGVDPTPVGPIARLKAALAKAKPEE